MTYIAIALSIIALVIVLTKVGKQGPAGPKGDPGQGWDEARIKRIENILRKSSK